MIDKSTITSFGLKAVIGIALIIALVGIVQKSLFYAEPGFIYHVRTLTGNEEVISDVGYRFYFLGR